MTRSRILIVVLGIAIWGGAGWFALRAGKALVAKVAASERPAQPAPPGAGDPGSASGWTAPERAAIEKAIREGSRPAVGDDAAPSPEREDLVALYGRYDPYFVRGDLNGDGRLDFVQAFVRRRDGNLVFDVAVFFGADGGGYLPPVFAEEGIALVQGDLAIDRTILVVTPDLAIDESYRLRFDPESRKFIDVDAAEGGPADDSPDPTPDRRPRARV